MLLKFTFVRFANVLRHGFSTSVSIEQVRVRFAPSPTGTLHLGGLRTALYNYAFAKSQNGVFILRIEDTDQARFVPGATEKLEETLKWVGIIPDEGPTQNGDYGPYFQSQRLHLYHEYLKILLENGSAYRCFCTEERLNLLRKEALKNRESPRYNNRCRYLSPSEISKNLAAKIPYTIRFKLESSDEPYNDLILGTICHDIGSVEGDPIIIKSDSYPTYHYANVVDDHLMKITHVLRGTEWQASTPKHLLMYKAFNWKPPQYAHLPLLLNLDGTKLSKRQDSLTVEHLQNQKYFVEAILDFVSNIGGGFSSKFQDKDYVATLPNLVKHFCFDKILNHSSCIEMGKLDTLNREYLKSKLENPSEVKKLIQELRYLVLQNFQDKMSDSKAQQQALEDRNMKKILRWSTVRIFTLSDLVKPEFEYLWVVRKDLQAETFAKLNFPAEKILTALIKTIEVLPSTEFTISSLNGVLKSFAKSQQLNYSSFMKFMREIIIGPKPGPPIAELLDILGQEISISRLQHALALISNKSKKYSLQVHPC